MPRLQKKYPDWVYNFQPPKSAIHFINGNYYVYGVSSKWDSEKQKAKKVTGKFLGKITPAGFIPSEKKALKESITIPHAVKNFGPVELCLKLLKNDLPYLQEFFPNNWKQIVLMAILRLINKTHLKMLSFHLQENYHALKWDVQTSEKYYSDLLSELGKNRETIIKFKKKIMHGKNFLLADSTNIFSESEQMETNALGYNSKRQYRPQVNLLYIFSSALMMPVYYRLVPGNIREVKAFKYCIEESGIKDAVIVMDKGFYSERNIKLLDDEGFQYIIPLRRNNKLIRYTEFTKVKQLENITGFFAFQERFIWFSRYEIDNNKWITIFFDEELKTEESQDYLKRIYAEYEGYDIEEYQKKEATFGTLSIYSNINDIKPAELYEQYKSRVNIEVLFDTFKNTLQADKTFMQKDDSLEGWMFINFLSIRLYYLIYQLLKEHDMISKISPDELLCMVNSIKMISINSEYHISEIPSKVEKLLAKINFPIT